MSPPLSQELPTLFLYIVYLFCDLMPIIHPYHTDVVFMMVHFHILVIVEGIRNHKSLWLSGLHCSSGDCM